MAFDRDPPPLPESPAAERNKGPILDVLKRVLPERGTVLELSSGTGQHAVHFARALPGVAFQPTEIDAGSIEVLHERQSRAALPNLEPPLVLDAREPSWPVATADAVLCINMIHIAPWTATEGLLEGARKVLPHGAPLVLYGPFFRSDAPTAPSNAAFDLSLKARNTDWGIRQLEEVTAAAGERGFELEELVEMPANNLVVVYRRA